MVWEVKLSDKHPNLSFRRGGVIFTKGKPVILKELSEVLQKELNLPNTPLEAVKIEDKIATLEKEIGGYEEKISRSDGEIYRGNLTPVRAIHKYCVQCSGNQKAPRHCANRTCPLFIFRLGKSPGRAGIGGGGNRKDFNNSSGQNLRKKGIVGADSG